MMLSSLALGLPTASKFVPDEFVAALLPPLLCRRRVTWICAPASSPRRQIAQRIHRLAVLADLEVKFDARRAARAHQRDFLPGIDSIAFLHKPLAVVAVSGKIRVVVLDDDQLAVTDQPVAAVHHGAGGGRAHWVANIAGDVDACAIAAAA